MVSDQKNKFETDELFKKLSQDVDVSSGHVALATCMCRTVAG